MLFLIEDESENEEQDNKNSEKNEDELMLKNTPLYSVFIVEKNKQKI